MTNILTPAVIIVIIIKHAYTVLINKIFSITVIIINTYFEKRSK